MQRVKYYELIARSLSSHSIVLYAINEARTHGDIKSWTIPVWSPLVGPISVRYRWCPFQDLLFQPPIALSSGWNPQMHHLKPSAAHIESYPIKTNAWCPTEQKLVTWCAYTSAHHLLTKHAIHVTWMDGIQFVMLSKSRRHPLHEPVNLFTTRDVPAIFSVHFRPVSHVWEDDIPSWSQRRDAAWQCLAGQPPSWIRCLLQGAPHSLI